MNISQSPIVCSECFRDEGLRLNAQQLGVTDSNPCPNCGAIKGHKLNSDLLLTLVHRFFVWGSLRRYNYGAAPLIQFNEHQTTSITVPHWLEADIRLIERTIDVGFFHYGPRLWMVGEIEPLKALQDPVSRPAIIENILQAYPSTTLQPEDTFYRLRKAPNSPEEPGEYDSPPSRIAGDERLDSPDFSVMYGSQDLQVCIHECRVTAEDDLYVATLASVSPLRLIDLSMLIKHDDVTEFESLDMAVHMLFLAGKHSYSITREIALAAHSAGFDGLVYPSYFSLLRAGCMPFATVYGISHRRIPRLQKFEQAKTFPNLAIFGRPIEEGTVEARCINRLILHKVEYGVHFGPVGFE